jgi:hypothetical protein
MVSLGVSNIVREIFKNLRDAFGSDCENSVDSKKNPILWNNL